LRYIKRSDVIRYNTKVGELRQEIEPPRNLPRYVAAAIRKRSNVEFSGTPAALSPEAPLERRVGPGAQEE